MFYGVGSKRRHIKAFIEAKLTDGGVVEVNAWRSAVTAKRIVAAVLSALTGEADDKLRCASCTFAAVLLMLQRQRAVPTLPRAFLCNAASVGAPSCAR